MEESLNNLYEELKALTYRSEHIRESFKSTSEAKSKVQVKAASHIDEQIKTITADAIIALEFINELAQCQDDSDIEILLESSEDAIQWEMII